MHSITIQMRCPQIEASTSSLIRQFEFQIKSVRVTGLVTSHDILVQVNGMIGDLIEQFLAQQDSISLDHAQQDYFLATEVHQHRIRRQHFTADFPLKSTFNRIETPFELNVSNLQESCLILSRFQGGLPWEMKFGLPFLLHVPSR